MLFVRRRLMYTLNDNPEYVNDVGNVYHKHEVYEGTTSKQYQNCEYMESFEAVNCVYSSPYNTTPDMFSGCANLKSIKMPKAQSLGHYVFEGLPNLEYLQLGSVGNPFTGGGYFKKGGGYAIGSDVGLTVEIYMETYPIGPIFMKGAADNTILIIRSSVTGEILME